MWQNCTWPDGHGVSCTQHVLGRALDALAKTQSMGTCCTKATISTSFGLNTKKNKAAADPKTPWETSKSRPMTLPSHVKKPYRLRQPFDLESIYGAKASFGIPGLQDL